MPFSSCVPHVTPSSMQLYSGAVGKQTFRSLPEMSICSLYFVTPAVIRPIRPSKTAFQDYCRMLFFFLL